jgi:hypothetical protein
MEFTLENRLSSLLKKKNFRCFCVSNTNFNSVDFDNVFIGNVTERLFCFAVEDIAQKPWKIWILYMSYNFLEAKVKVMIS